MLLAIIGSRKYPQRCEQEVRNFVLNLPSSTRVLSGGAIGVDSWAGEASLQRDGRLYELVPNYSKYKPNVAPLIRNEKIARLAYGVVAFWDGDSSGTIHACKYARKLGKPVKVYLPGMELVLESVWSI